jgi:hypothetical protein
MAKCKDIDPNKTDFKNPNSILQSLLSLLKIKPPSIPGGAIPAQLLLGARCGGFNSSEIASKIIQRQAQAGIPVGPLEDGTISPDEIMEKIRVEEMVEAISTKLVMQVAIQPGTSLQGTGANLGGPVAIAGTTIGIAKGKAMVCNG